ncbi:MAG: DUF2254 domain-containing protein [Acidobacteriaceae bacterium]
MLPSLDHLRTYLARWIDRLRTGFWFVPSLMLFLAAGLALLLLRLDNWADPGIKSSITWAYSGGPQGARALLSTIAGSMITAASVTFSLAAVALSIASQQYGSRVLRNFMRDRITQVLLGTFVSTFIYCVLVVRSIRGSEYSGFVPAISITVAISLALVSLVMLIYFIHHISTSIQASHIVSVIATSIQKAIPELYPAEAGQQAPSAPATHDFRSGTQTPVQTSTSGYLQSVDLKSLLNTATHHQLVVEILPMPGAHLLQGDALAHLWSAQPLNDTSRKQRIDDVCESFALGSERTPEQDIRFPFQQLTDVIVRALSPGINDPFTAINGIDELTTGIALLARTARVQEYRRDRTGALRVIAPRPHCIDILNETVGHIAVYAAADPFVMDRLRRVIDAAQNHLNSVAEQEQLQRLRSDVNRRQKNAAQP